MAGKSDAFEYDFLRMTFCAKAITNIAATAGTTAVWLAACTADPGDAGSTAAEGGYAQYTRVSVDRSTAGWTVTSGTSAAVATASPTTAVNFPQNTSTSTGTFTHLAVYPSSSSVASAMLYFGAISPTINFAQNVTPQITTGSSVTED
jgi:hypothetical protein